MIWPGAVGLRLGDYRWRGGRVYLAKTGNHAAVDRRLLAEVAGWLLFYAIVRARAAWLRPWRGRGRAIAFAPDRPHPRYLVRTAAIWAGLRAVCDSEAADVRFAFEDRTVREDCDRLNGGCGDISKSRVAAVFARVFGYPLAIDPAVWVGEAVEKGEANGVHDGRIVTCPRSPQPGRVYERLIDTVAADGRLLELRVQCVGGSVVAAWEKRRDPARRFAPPSLTARLVAVDAVLNADEMAKLAAFARAMGADWCGLDVLRDCDGRIYVVDCNTTDAGPIVALSLADKLRSTAILARALIALVAGAKA